MLIKLIIVLFAAAFCFGACWLSYEKQKRRIRNWDRRRREAIEVDIIQLPREQEIKEVKACDGRRSRGVV